MFPFHDVIKESSVSDSEIIWVRFCLTYCGQVTPYGDIEPGQHRSRKWLAVSVTAPSHCLDHYCLIIRVFMWHSHEINSRRTSPLLWRHNGHDCVSNHQPGDCLLSRLFRRRSKQTSKLRVTGLCVGNSPGTGEFPTQMASNAENVSIWYRHHETTWFRIYLLIFTHNFNDNITLRGPGVYSCVERPQELCILKYRLQNIGHFHSATACIEWSALVANCWKLESGFGGIAHHITSAMASHLMTSSCRTVCSLSKLLIKENIKTSRHWPLWWESIHRWPVDSPHRGSVARKMFPFDDVIMTHQMGMSSW